MLGQGLIMGGGKSGTVKITLFSEQIRGLVGGVTTPTTSFPPFLIGPFQTICIRKGREMISPDDGLKAEVGGPTKRVKSFRSKKQHQMFLFD